MIATAVFNNDPSVGIFPSSYDIELPLNEFENDEHKEEVRQLLKGLYTQLDGEMGCSYVLFDGETD